ncbi:hypothetical protein [Actinophytocola sp.]|uniref:hypothetical protein n=1 Tax=Actinophytocola sp. TaxID=1872138 RepID=UPI002ED33B0B
MDVKRKLTALAAGATLLGAGAAVPTTAGAAAGRVETPVASGSPITEVIETAVRVHVPLPASAGPHPAACDWLSYLRFRHASGPARSADADRVLVAQPGILEGAGAFDSVARNTIVEAARRGSHIEFWALDRRSNCLEDHTGLSAGLAARDFHVAVDYYYRSRPVAGRTFAGFLDNSQLGWLGRVGLEQTVRDQYDLLVAELPDPAVRRQKVLCGGHSLGGILTGFFSVWDFDGNHATTADAGYRQCGGYFALDTSISTSLGDLTGGMPVENPDLSYAATQVALETGLLTRSLSLPILINAETMNLLGIAGLAAVTAPGAECDLARSLPSNLNVDTTQRILFSKDLLTFLAGTPTTKDFRLTNEAALGALLDDHSQPLAFLETSVGFFDGGPVVDKDFPLPHELKSVPGLEGLTAQLGVEPMAIPDTPRGPLYTWRNYNRIGAPDDPVYKRRDGQPFTGAGKEVTDIQELARSLAEHPLDFTEQYFPTKLSTDLFQSEAPQVSEDAVHEVGLTANPTIRLLAGDSFTGSPTASTETIVMPGYQHLDVLTAAPRQNNGRPEQVAVNLARFAVS